MVRTKFSVQLITYLSGFSGLTAYSAIFGALLVCGLGVPIPEDITLIAAGILAALKNISFTGAITVGIIGVLVGDCFLFFLGRRFGYRVFELPIFKTIFNEKRISQSREKVLANSKFICFTARFLPGLRAPIFLTAGIMGVNPLTFLLLDGFAAVISVPVWVYVGWYFGYNLDHTLAIALRAQKYIVVSVILLIFSYVLFKMRQKRRNEKKINAVKQIPLVSEDIHSPQV